MTARFSFDFIPLFPAKAGIQTTGVLGLRVNGPLEL